MTDITVESNVRQNTDAHTQPRNLVWTSPNVGYIFFVNGSIDLQYRKTTDGGTTWGTAVTIRTGSISKYAIWYDGWTPGDTGDVIHICFIDYATDDYITYNSFSISDDVLKGDVTVLVGTLADSAESWASSCITIFVGGWKDNTSTVDSGLFKATMASGVATSFTSKNSLADLRTVDRIQLLPGNEVDTEDIWCIYQDISTSSMTLKVFDDSLNTWSESATISSITEDKYTFNWDSVVRHSDGHTILVLWNAYQSTTADLNVFDITNITTWTQKTDVISNNAPRLPPPRKIPAMTAATASTSPITDPISTPHPPTKAHVTALVFWESHRKTRRKT